MLDLLVLPKFLAFIGPLALLRSMVLWVVSPILLHLLTLSKSLISKVLGLLDSSFVLGLEGTCLQAFKLLWD